jgi:hypothetical protein
LTQSSETALALGSFAISPTSVTGGDKVGGIVRLTAAAPAGGVSVGLKSSSTNAVISDATITILAGTTERTFSFSTKPVTAMTTVTLTATLGSVTKTALLTVKAMQAPSLSSLSVDPKVILGGLTTTGNIALSGPAPAGGAAVTVTSSNTNAATADQTIVVAAGQTTRSFTIATKPVKAITAVTFTATLGGVSKLAPLYVTPPAQAAALSSLSIDPQVVQGGSSTMGTIVLSGPAPDGGASLAIASNNTAASAPVTIVVPAGKTAQTFSISTKTVTANTAVTLTATLGNVSKSAPLYVTPPVSSLAGSFAGAAYTPTSFKGSVALTRLTLTSTGGVTGTFYTLSPSGETGAVPFTGTLSGSGQLSLAFTLGLATGATGTVAHDSEGKILTVDVREKLSSGAAGDEIFMILGVSATSAPITGVHTGGIVFASGGGSTLTLTIKASGEMTFSGTNTENQQFSGAGYADNSGNIFGVFNAGGAGHMISAHLTQTSTGLAIKGALFTDGIAPTGYTTFTGTLN